MFGFLFQSALADFLRSRRLAPWLAVLIAVSLVGVAWKYVTPRATTAEVYTQVASILLFRILALMSALFTTAIVSQEVEQRTISYLLTRPIPRRNLLIARYLASVAVVVALGAFGTVALSVGVFGTHFLSNEFLVKDIVAIVFGAFAYGAVFLLVSLLINRAMIVCLLYAFGWETAIPNMPGELYYTSIFSYVQAIAEHPSSTVANRGPNLLGMLSGELGLNTLTRGTAITALVVLTVAAASLSAWWFTHFEYVPREDAE